MSQVVTRVLRGASQFQKRRPSTSCSAARRCDMNFMAASSLADHRSGHARPCHVRHASFFQKLRDFVTPSSEVSYFPPRPVTCTIHRPPSYQPEYLESGLVAIRPLASSEDPEIQKIAL